MYLLAWIVIGGIVGWGAGSVFQGNGYSPLMDILMGIGGSVVGGFWHESRASTDTRERSSQAWLPWSAQCS
jgi:uncharacterized membrane protein YeaQ/YmgE (transglycosylase-associated protein family)